MAKKTPKLKSIKWIFGGIGVAVIVAIFGFFGQADQEPVAVTGDTIGEASEQVVGNIESNGSVTIIQSQNSKSKTLPGGLDEKEVEFTGALEGYYEQVENGNRAYADFSAKEVSFMAGNCQFFSSYNDVGGALELYLVHTDGICSFLQEFEKGEKIGRVIPLPGAMSNSGRILEFFFESGPYNIESFAGTYKEEPASWQKKP